jgi:hypothetical protein
LTNRPSLGINDSIRASIVQIPAIAVLKIDSPQQVPDMQLSMPFLLDLHLHLRRTIRRPVKIFAPLSTPKLEAIAEAFNDVSHHLRRTSSATAGGSGRGKH